MSKGGKCKNSENVEKGNIFPIIKETTSKSSKGILRSHDRFPWNYRRPLGTRHQSQWTSFYHRLEAPTTGQDLLIKVVNFDLDPRDTLQFRVDGVIRKISETDVGKLKTYYKCKKLEVNFTVQHGGFSTRSGFLILYEWIINSKPEMFLKIPVFYDQKCNRSDVDISSKKSRKPEIKKDKCGVKKAKNRTDEKTTDIIIGQKNKTQKKRSRKKRRLETIKKSS